MEQINILVVDDEKEIADLVEIYLVSDGYKVFKANNAKEGLEILDQEEIHLVLLVKPFNPLELTARVKSQLRRYTQLNPNSNTGKAAKNEISIRGLSINKDNHKVVVYGEEIKLTPIEFDILYLLASNPGRVFSTDEIFEKVWNEKVYEANNTVMVHIRRLRGKMKEDTRQDKIITTVWGVGYKIEK